MNNTNLRYLSYSSGNIIAFDKGVPLVTASFLV